MINIIERNTHPNIPKETTDTNFVKINKNRFVKKKTITEQYDDVGTSTTTYPKYSRI